MHRVRSDSPPAAASSSSSASRLLSTSIFEKLFDAVNLPTEAKLTDSLIAGNEYFISSSAFTKNSVCSKFKQSDGNALVLSKDGKPVWCEHPLSKEVYFLAKKTKFGKGSYSHLSLHEYYLFQDADLLESDAKNYKVANDILLKDRIMVCCMAKASKGRGGSIGSAPSSSSTSTSPLCDQESILSPPMLGSSITPPILPSSAEFERIMRERNEMAQTLKRIRNERMAQALINATSHLLRTNPFPDAHGCFIFETEIERQCTDAGSNHSQAAEWAKFILQYRDSPMNAQVAPLSSLFHLPQTAFEAQFGLDQVPPLSSDSGPTLAAVAFAAHQAAANAAALASLPAASSMYGSYTPAVMAMSASMGPSSSAGVPSLFTSVGASQPIYQFSAPQAVPSYALDGGFPGNSSSINNNTKRSRDDLNDQQQQSEEQYDTWQYFDSADSPLQPVKHTRLSSHAMLEQTLIEDTPTMLARLHNPSSLYFSDFASPCATTPSFLQASSYTSFAAPSSDSQHSSKQSSLPPSAYASASSSPSQPAVQTPHAPIRFSLRALSSAAPSLSTKQIIILNEEEFEIDLRVCEINVETFKVRVLLPGGPCPPAVVPVSSADINVGLPLSLKISAPSPLQTIYKVTDDMKRTGFLRLKPREEKSVEVESPQPIAILALACSATSSDAKPICDPRFTIVQ